jgi:hypothetical protein
MRAGPIIVFAAMAGAAGLLTFACGSDSDPASTSAPDGSAESSTGTSDGSSSTSSGGSSGTTSGGPRPADEAGVTADGGVNADARPGGDTTKIACGATTCPIPAESCCVIDLDRGTAYACVAGTTCPRAPRGEGDGRSAALRCSSAANCAAGTVCCVREEREERTVSECKATCADREEQLCDPALADGGSGCPANERCSTESIRDWGLPRTFGTCGGRDPR